MRHQLKTLALACAIATGPALAGGQLDTFKFTGQSTIAPGFEDVRVVPIRWDDRCTTIPYVLNIGVLPNQGTPNEVSVEELVEIVEATFEAWNRIPTSYIRFELADVRVTGNSQRGFDFINEITFATPPNFGALAFSPSVSLQQDVFLPPGADLNGDGIADVFDPEELGINHCFLGEDGRLKHPAGFYAAGTILENDVAFNTNVLWATEPGPVGADIKAVAVHEFGHSHGLAHSFINQISPTNRFGSTMFPFIATNDGEAEQATRQPHVDDIAWSSLVYPRQRGVDGPAAVGPGDQAFDEVFQVVTGEVTNIDGLGIPGANVYARTRDGQEILVNAHAGEVQLVANAAGGLFTVNPEAGIISGNFRLPLPRGQYELFLQSPDVGGATGSNISTTSLVGGLYGLVGFDEEGIDNPQREGAFERQPGRAQNVTIRPGTGSQPPVMNAVINESVQLQDFTAQSFGGTGAALTNGVTYAKRFAGGFVLELLESGAEITTGTFSVTAFDAALAPTFRRAALALGRLDENGVASIERVMGEEAPFVGQKGDLSPFYFSNANGISRSVQQALRRDPGLDVFLLLEPFDPSEVALRPGGSLPPLLALQSTVATGNSFLAVNGGPLEPLPTTNWLIQLILTP